MAHEKIFIVEDEEDILEVIKFNLLKEAYRVTASTNGIDALKNIVTVKPDLVILDIMLPDINGIQILKNIKSDKNLNNIPIVMLTAKGEESDIVQGLEMGADDYITKPFSPKVLLARIKAVLRRNQQQNTDNLAEIIIRNSISINPTKYEVLIDNKPVTMTRTEFDLLHFLIQKPGWVFTRNQIIEAVQGEGYPATDRSVDVQIVGLRKKLGSAGDFIETVRGVGYRFKEIE